MIKKADLVLTERCNLNCLHCQSKDTLITTSKGVKEIADIEVGEMVLTSQGTFAEVTKTFTHHQNPSLLSLKPYYLPPLKLTGNHKVFTLRDEEIKKIEASELTTGDYLVIPIPQLDNLLSVIDLSKYLEGFNFKKEKRRRKLDKEKLKTIRESITTEKTSDRLAKELELHPAYIRKIRGQLKRGTIEPTWIDDSQLIFQGDKLRFKYARKWIPRYITDIPAFCRLLGHFVADGDICQSKNRRSSFSVRFSIGKHKVEKIEDIISLLEQLFLLKPCVHETATAMQISITNTCAGLLFRELCGSHAGDKKIPSFIFNCDKPSIKQFLEGYITGDGYTNVNKGREVTSAGTLSRKLAYGLVALYLSIGELPTLYEGITKPSRIEGRLITSGKSFYTVGITNGERVYAERVNDCWAVKIKEITSVPYKDRVYDLQVDDTTHSYIANGMAVSNCFMYDAGNNRTIREPSQKQVLDTFETLASNGVTKLNMWGGEVHLRQDFYEILKPALDMFSQVSIQTHGAVETYLGFLHKDYPHLGVHISLEGWGRDDELIRGKGHFLRAKRNIEMLAKQMGENLTIRTTIFNGNNVIPLIQMALDLGCSWVGVRFKPVGRGQKLLKLQPSRERLAELYQIVASVRKSHKNILLEETPFYLYDEYLSQKYQNYFLKKGYACEWGRRIVVDVDGKAYPCPYAMTPSLYLGSIIEDDFKVIEENYRTLIKQRQNTELTSQCSICPLRDACFGGCSIYSLFNEENKLGDPLCPIPLLFSGEGTKKQKQEMVIHHG